ncbi:MAG: succinate dehydrogenase assembly factor 2 [Pseudomonadota bacterium]
MSDLDPRRKQLLYRAQHRGIRECDLLIGGFAAAHIAEMSEPELVEFEALLKLPDRDLYKGLSGEAEAPANVSGPVYERLKAFDVSKTILG